MPPKKKNQEELLSEISKKLDVISRLLALSLPKTINQNHKMKILSELGLQPKDIANIIGTTANTVRVELSKIKKASNVSEK